MTRAAGPIPICNLILALMLALMLAACAGALRWNPETYTVKEGDTLYSIAFRHGLDYRDLAEWNDIGRGYLIYPGDELVLSPKAGARDSSQERRASRAPGRDTGRDTGRETSGDRQAEGGRQSDSQGGGGEASSAPQHRADLQWAWPLEGELLSVFGEGAMGKGIQIAAAEGDPVKAAASGRIVYTGSGLIGYGKLIIIKHDDVFLSAYGHNRDILVDEGDEVKAGDRIARVGLGRGNRSMLHFEIRSEGNAVDPLPYLPDRD